MDALNNIENDINFYEEQTLIDTDEQDNAYFVKIINTRGLVDNYSLPIASSLATLYERLLIRVHNKIDIDILTDMRNVIKESKIGEVNEGFFESIARKDKLQEMSPNDEIISKYERTLYDIQNASIDILTICADFSSMSKINIELILKFCKGMAEIDLKYLYSQIELADRNLFQEELILITQDIINNNLSKIGISNYNFNYEEVMEFLKNIY